MRAAMRRYRCRKATNPPVATEKAKNDAEEKEKESVGATNFQTAKAEWRIS